MKRPTLVRFGALVALPVLAGCGVQSYAPPPGVCEPPSQAHEYADQLFRLINMERALEGLDPLTWDEQLAKAAQSYSCRMIEGGFFGHTDPDTKTAPNQRLSELGYAYVIMGENLALGQDEPAEVIDNWMASPSHRDNILSPQWRDIGIGVRTDEHGTLTWVVEFAEPS